MTGRILNSLLDSGFFPENEGVSVSIYGRKYSVTEEKGTIYIISENPVKSSEMKNKNLDAVEKIAGRYGITSAGFRGDSLFVVLSAPGANTGEETRRIKFLIQSLSRIRDSEAMKDEAEKDAETSQRPVNSEPTLVTSKGEYNPDRKSITDKKSSSDITPLNPAGVSQDLKPTEPRGTEGEHSKEGTSPEEVYRATARKGSKTYSAYGYTRDREGRKLEGSYISSDNLSPEESMIMEEENNREEDYREISPRRGLDEFKGTVGIILGVIISLIILGLLYKAYILSDYFAFIMGIIVYFGYRSLTGRKPANLKASVTALILGSFLLTVIMNGIEISELTRAAGQNDTMGFSDSLLRGFSAFFNNRRYIVSVSWSSFMISVFSSLTGYFLSFVFTEKGDRKRNHESKKISMSESDTDEEIY